MGDILSKDNLLKVGVPCVALLWAYHNGHLDFLFSSGTKTVKEKK